MPDHRFDWGGSQPRQLNRRDKVQFAVVILLLLGLLGALAIGVSWPPHRKPDPSSGTTEQSR